MTDTCLPARKTATEGPLLLWRMPRNQMVRQEEEPVTEGGVRSVERTSAGATSADTSVHTPTDTKVHRTGRGRRGGGFPLGDIWPGTKVFIFYILYEALKHFGQCLVPER